MTRAGRAWAAAAVALVLALGACGTTAAPAAPRTPAPVQASWAGCEAVGAFGDDDRGQGPSGVGGVPDGFTPTRAVLCEAGERQNARGDTVDVDLERTATDVGSLLTYLAQPDERATDGACPAIAILPPWLFLLDASGRYVAPAVPKDACGLPLGWQGERSAWEALTYTDRVVTERGVQESAEVKRSGCTSAWKDAVADYASSSHVRPGTFTGDPFGGRDLRVCVYEVPPADRGSDAAPGEFSSGGPLDEQDRSAVVAELRAAPETPPTCRGVNGRFATLAPTDGGPFLYVELDGCRRVVSDGDETPVVRASDELVALLGG